MQLFDKLKMAEDETRRHNVRRYAALLEKGESASAEELSEIQGLLRKLGLTAAQAGEHIRALAERKRLIALVESVRALEKTKRAAEVSHSQLEAETEAKIQEMREKVAELLFARHEAERAYFAAYRASNRLFELEAMNPELFGLTKDDIENKRPRPVL